MSTDKAISDSTEESVEPKTPSEVSETRLAQTDRQEDIIDVRMMLGQLKRKWWLILTFLLIAMWSGITTIQKHSSAFNAIMVVAPSETTAQPERQTGTIAGLAGVRFGSQTKNETFQRMKIVATTLELAHRLNDKYDLMKVVYGSSWDEKTGTWLRPTGDRFIWDQKVKAFFRLPLWTEPSIEDLAAFIGGTFKIEPIEDSEYQRISFAHAEPEKALWYLKIVYAEITEFIHQQEVIAQAQRRDYLESRLAQTQIVEFRNALLGLLSGVTRKEMMLQGDTPGEVVVLDPPYLSKYKTSPSILTTLGIRILGALALAFVLIVLWTLYRAE